MAEKECSRIYFKAVSTHTHKSPFSEVPFQKQAESVSILKEERPFTAKE